MKGLLGPGREVLWSLKRFGRPFSISVGCTLLFFLPPLPPQTTESQLYFLTATKVKWKILPPSPAGYLPGGEGPRKVLGGAVTETTH